MTGRDNFTNTNRKTAASRKLLVFPGLVGSRQKVSLSESLKRLIMTTYIAEEKKVA